MHSYSNHTLSLLLAGTLVATSADAEPLGRLFHSPAERDRLDHPQAAPRPPAPPPRLDGIVARGDGRTTLFLDGQATPADPRHVSVGDATARVSGSDGRTHRLRVGDPPADIGKP